MIRSILPNLPKNGERGYRLGVQTLLTDKSPMTGGDTHWQRQMNHER